MAAKKVPFYSKVPFLVVELLGLALSTYMFMISTGMLGKDLLPCGRSKWFACEKIIQGPFSHLGPISVAATGVIYYLLHLSLTAGLRDRVAQIIKVAAVFGGLFFIAWLRSLELIYIHKICPWCWGVAALTLIHAGISYSLALPFVPRLRPFALGAWVFGGFIVLVGLVTLLEHGLKTGEMLLNQGWKTTATASGPSAAGEGIGQTKKSMSSPKSTATPKVQTSPVPPQQPVRQATPTPAPRTQAAGTQSALPPEPQLVNTPEVRTLRANGWRHAASGEDVIAILKARGAVLLIAYDPLCRDCHNLIMNVLPAPELQNLPVTKVAIQESMLSGQINGMISSMPTILLFSATGELLFTQVGSGITPKDLADRVRAGVQPNQ